MHVVQTLHLNHLSLTVLTALVITNSLVVSDTGQKYVQKYTEFCPKGILPGHTISFSLILKQHLHFPKTPSELRLKSLLSTPLTPQERLNTTQILPILPYPHIYTS